MRKRKLISAWVLASMMAFAPMTTLGVFASEDETQTETETETETGTTKTKVPASGDFTVTGEGIALGDTYNLYPIFTGEWEFTDFSPSISVGTNDMPMTNIGGRNIAFTEKFRDKKQGIMEGLNALLDTLTPEATEGEEAPEVTKLTADSVPADYVTAMMTVADGGLSNQMAKMFAKIVENENITTTINETGVEGNRVVFPQVPTGYYLFMGDLGNKNRTTPILTPIAGDTAVEDKTAIVAFEKKLMTDGAEGKRNWVEVREDKVEDTQYILRTSIPAISDFAEFNFKVEDTLPAGLGTTAQEVKDQWGLTVEYVRGQLKEDITREVTVTEDTNAQNEQLLIFKMEGLKEYLKGINEDLLGEDAEIVIKYTPVYDTDDIKEIFENFETTDKAKTNTAKLVYWEKTEDESQETKEDSASVYTNKLEIRVYDDAGEALEGAKFTVTDEEGNEVDKVLSEEGGVLKLTGLDSGKKYTVTCDEVPEWYEKPDPITFTLEDHFSMRNPGAPEYSILTPEGELPEGIKITSYKAGNLGGIVSIQLVKEGSIAMPGTGTIGGIIVIAISLGALGTGTTLVLKKED